MSGSGKAAEARSGRHGFIAGFWPKSEEERERERGELIEIGGSFCNHRYFSFRLFRMSDDIGGSFIN